MIDKNDPRLTAFVLGELDEQETQAIQKEVEESLELKQAVEEIRATTELLVKQFADEPVGSLTDEQRATILAAGSSTTTPKKVNAKSHSVSPTYRRRWAIGAIAASLALVLGSMIYHSIDWSANPGVAKNEDGKKIAKVTPDSKPRPSKLDKSALDESDQSVGFQMDGKSNDSKRTEDVVGTVRPGAIREENQEEESQNDNFIRERFKNIGGDFGRSQNGIVPDESREFYDRNIEELDRDHPALEPGLGETGDDLPSEIDGRLRKFGAGGGGGGLGGSGRGSGGIESNREHGQLGGRNSDSENQGHDNQPIDSDEDRDAEEEDLPSLRQEYTDPSSVSDKKSDDRRVVDSNQESDQTDRIIRTLVERVDPTGTKDVILEAAKEDLRVLVDGEPVDRLNLSSLVELDESLKLDFSAGDLKDGGKKEELLEELHQQINEKLAVRNRRIAEARKSWKRVKATANTSRLMVGDKDELNMQGMQVNVQVDGFRARVLIDCFYYNDRPQQLEGNFKLRLPDDASLYYFAFGQSSHEFVPQGQLSEHEFIQPENGEQFVSLQPSDIARERGPAWESVKEARMVPREKAALAYTQTVRRKVDPALVEWSGAGVFAARVFPLMPQKLHRIVIGYDVSLTQTENGLKYRLDLPEELGQCKVDLNVTSVVGAEVSVTPAVKPKGDSDQYLYTFTNSKLGDQRSIELDLQTTGSVLLQSNSPSEGSFWTAQVTPDLPKENAATNSHAVFLLDTSLSSNPDKFNVWLKLLRETLDKNRDSMKQFSVVLFNVESYFWQDKYVENTVENVDQLLLDCEKLALEGATDLYSATHLLSSTPWVTADEQSPDVFLLSDGAANWGETNLRLIQDRMASARLGSLFAYQTGMTGTSINGLRFLADRSGGAVFSVTSEDEIAQAATAHRNRPWQIKSMELDGGTDLMTAGRISWVYPGQTITLVGRGDVEGDLKLTFSQGDIEKSVTTEFVDSIDSTLASRMYGYVSVGQLESLGSHIEDVAAAYARHFRITGNTCSLLMLESEEDYERFNIVPQEDLFVIKTRDAVELIDKTLEEKKAELVSPKVRLVNWIHKLENMPGVTFEVPVALDLVMDKIEVEAITAPLVCKNRNKADLDEKFLQELSKGELGYDKILAESKKRGLGAAHDAIKVLSSLVEQNPGDLTLARDVAFVAMELEEPAQAYSLLRRVALARPYEPTIYPAIGKCLNQLGKADMAIVFYEVALEAQFQNRGADYRKIVAAEYMHLLRKIDSGTIESNIKDYASQRLASLNEKLDFGEKDIVITMMWNTDQSDVDLHVIEPNGEDCHYGHRETKSGGQITRDVTDGFGPEMYTLRDAPLGKFQIKVKYFGSNANRTNMRSKVYLTIYRNYGQPNESVTFKSVDLLNAGDLQDVHTIGIE